MTATIDEIVTVGANPTREIEDGSSASSSTALTTKGYTNKRTGGVLLFSGDSVDSALSTSYASSTMNITLTASQADNQIFRIASATSHANISTSDDVKFVFPSGTTGAKFIHKSTDVSATFEVGSGGSTASVGKSSDLDVVLLVNSAAYLP